MHTMTMAASRQLTRPRKVRAQLAVVAVLVASLFAQLVPATTVENSLAGTLIPDSVTELVFSGDASACGFWETCYYAPDTTWNRFQNNSRAAGSYIWGGVRSTASGAVQGGIGGAAVGWASGTSLGNRLSPITGGISGGVGVAGGAIVGGIGGGAAGGVAYVWGSIFG